MTVLKTQSIKFGVRWGSSHEGVVKEWLSEQQISEGRFIEIFSGEVRVEV
jgi:hypothetical protein